MQTYRKTQRLEIGPMTDADQPALAVLLLDEQIKQTYMIPDFADEQALARMQRRFIALSQAGEHFVRGIYLDGSLIGFVNDVESDADSMELGYVIHPHYWGQGYATEMLTAVMDLLRQRGFQSVRAGAFLENPASIRVMEKCGMHRCLQTEQIEYRGRLHTCVYYKSAL